MAFGGANEAETMATSWGNGEAFAKISTARLHGRQNLNRCHNDGDFWVGHGLRTLLVMKTRWLIPSPKQKT